MGEIYIANSDLLVKMPDCTSGWLETSDAGCIQQHRWQDCACRRQLPRSDCARFKDETFNRTRPMFSVLDFICSKQKGLINTSITSRSQLNELQKQDWDQVAELNVSLAFFREIDFLNVTNTCWDSDILLDVFDVDNKQNILNKTVHYSAIKWSYCRLFYTACDVFFFLFLRRVD